MSGCPHFDLTDPDTYQGGLPRDVFKYLRHEQPVYWHEDPKQGVGFWVITRQEDLDYVSKNPLLFSSAQRSCLLNEMEGDQLAMVQTQLINMDPPQHLNYRRLVRAAFTPKMVDSYEDRFREIARGLVDKAVEDEPLSDEDFCNFFLLLIVAGNETTRTVTSQGMRMLMEHPEQYQALVENPALIDDAIEECLRYNPAVIAFRRTATEDVVVGGQAIRQGDKIQMYYGAASADEAVFADPDTFDITRNQREDVRNEHRAFGIGQHFYMGSHLARLELRIVFQEITRRIRNPRLDGDISWLRSNFISGIKSMPIAFDVANKQEAVSNG